MLLNWFIHRDSLNYPWNMVPTRFYLQWSDRSTVAHQIWFEADYPFSDVKSYIKENSEISYFLENISTEIRVFDSLFLWT